MIMLAVGFVIFVAAFTQGLAGFGFALVAAPMLAVLLSATESVALMLGVTTCLNLYLLVRYRHQIELKKFLRLAIVTPVGVGFGGLLLPYMSSAFLTSLMAGIALIVVGSLLVSRRQHALRSPALVRSAGVLSGFLNVTVGMGGTPALLLLEKQHVRKRTMIGDLAAYFLVLNIFSISALVLTVELPERTPWLMMSVLPLALAGLLVGQFFCACLRESNFHSVVVLLICSGAAIALVRGLALL